MGGVAPWLIAMLCGATAAPDAASLALQSVRAFEQGRFGEAQALATALSDMSDLPADLAQTALLVEAFSRLRLDDDATPEALARLASEGPAMGTSLHYVRIEALCERGDCEGASSLAAALPDDSPFASLGWLQVVSCWSAARDYDDAQVAAAKAEQLSVSDARRADAMLVRGRLAELAGPRKASRDLYRDLVVKYPLTAAAHHAMERLAELQERGLAVRPLAAEELLPRAEAESSLTQTARARRTYANVLARAKGQATVRQAAQLGLTELDIVDRRYLRALHRVDEVLAGASDPDLRAQALYLKADVLSRRAEAEPALALYTQATAELPDTAFAAESALSAARLAYSMGQYDRAQQFCRWLLNAPATATDIEIIGSDGIRQAGRSESALKDQALWMLAWIERRQKSPPSVVDSYLAQIDAAGALADAALYWRARLAIEGGNLGDAEVFADMLVKSAPASYYALSAGDLMARASPSCNVHVQLATSAADDAAPDVLPRDLAGPIALFRHGLVSEAQRLLKLLPAGKLAVPDRVAAAWLYGRCGDVHQAHVLTRAVADHADDLSDPVLLGLAYPQPYRDVVDEMGATYGVPAELIYAIIRQESAFDPHAVSPRRARGLMQMIRPTATRMAREADLTTFRHRQLYNPEVSVRLGTLYLASLLDRFHGNVAAAVAAYHAGETAVERWLDRNGDIEVDEFIEEIPYSGTRTYVKKVLASYGVYRLLYHETSGPALVLQRD